MDLNNVLYMLGTFTVDRLKLVLRTINTNHGGSLKLSGLKLELLNRVKGEVINAHSSHNVTLFNALKVLINDARTANTSVHAIGPAPTHEQLIAQAHARQQQQMADDARRRAALGDQREIDAQRAARYASYQPPAQQHLPLPPPRFNNNNNDASGSGAARPPPTWSSGTIEGVPLRFRTSPFYRIEKALGPITTCVKAGQGDRKTVHANFTLSEPQRQLLIASKAMPTGPQYQVRLYSTNEEYFNIARAAAGQNPAPIDFPATVEVRLNNHPVTANMKGIKKSVGTAPPVDLTATKGMNGVLAMSLGAGATNRIEINYSNTERRYFLVVYLVQVTSIKQVVDKMRTGKVRSKADVIAGIIKQNSDPDLEASSFELSLKDPLTFGRIKTPVRSVSCNHLSCFDAQVFFMMNEQTPTWKCPICSNVLRPEDVTVDGFFDDILKICSSSVEKVTIEPDGTWRSADDLHGTAQPRPGKVEAVPIVVSSTIDKGKGKALDQDTLTLDSDEDDKPIINHRLILLDDSRASSRSGTEAPKRSSECIDLTLSDSDEEQIVYTRPPKEIIPAHNGIGAKFSDGTPATGGQAFWNAMADPYADRGGSGFGAYSDGAKEKRQREELEAAEAHKRARGL